MKEVINLRKAQTIDLRKQDGVPMVTPYVSIGWDTAPEFASSQDIDMDIFAMLQDEDGVSLGAEHFIFYNTVGRKSACGGIEISPDNRTGEGDGDDEWLKFDFNAIDPRCAKVTVGVSINDADIKLQNFSMIDNAFIRIAESEHGREHAKLDLAQKFGQYEGVVFGTFERKGNEWLFMTIAEGLQNGISEFVSQFNFESKR
ncbi:TerD family protein [Vibrio splendidus]|nr:TerD family protein [Vibrio splendidus]MCC4883095.1 TerD family protein [Vibrio splendidus]